MQVATITSLRAFTRLIRRAQQTGALRADFVHQDRPLILMANAGLVRATTSNASATARLIEYLLQAFRAPATDPLPPPPTPRTMFTALEAASRAQET